MGGKGGIGAPFGPGNGGIGIPRPPGGGSIPGIGGIPLGPGIPNGGGGPPTPGKPKAGGGKGWAPGFWASMGFEEDCPSAAYEEVIESMTDCAFS